MNPEYEWVFDRVRDKDLVDSHHYYILSKYIDNSQYHDSPTIYELIPYSEACACMDKSDACTCSDTWCMKQQLICDVWDKHIPDPPKQWLMNFTPARRKT